MGTFQRHEVRTLLGRALRPRSAFLLLAGATVMMLVGYAWPRAEMEVVAAVNPRGSASTTLQPAQRDAGPVGGRVADEEVSYAAPDPTILAAFLACAASGSGEHVFVPAEVPTGSRLVPRPRASGDSGDAVVRRGPTVVISAQGGYLAFYDALDGSFTNLPGAPCGMVDGRPASGRRVLGGESVQWEAEGVLHAVFGWGLSRAVVVRVATSMRPMNAVDHVKKTPSGPDRRRGL